MYVPTTLSLRSREVTLEHYGACRKHHELEGVSVSDDCSIATTRSWRVTPATYGTHMIYNRLPISTVKALMRWTNDRRHYARRPLVRERNYQRFLILTRVVFARTQGLELDI